MKTILVIDDDVTIVRVSELILSTTYTVLSALSAEEGVELYETNSIDLVVLDIKMGTGMSGFEFFAHMKTRFNDLRCLVYTGLTDKGKLQVMINGGVVGVMYKPASLIDYQDQVKRAMEAHLPPSLYESPCSSY